MAIEIIVTIAGRAALVNAANTGTNAVTITQLGMTAGVFVPNAAQVALPGEIKRIASIAGLVVADDQIHITASDVTTDAYAMRGFALYLNDGTLFAIYGQAGPILNKTAESMMLLAADIAFADIDAEMIEFGDTNFVLPAATTEILGLVELATTAEAQAGSDTMRVLTPLVGKQSVLGWLLSQDGAGSGLDADMLDGQHAAAFALAAHNHNISALTGYGTMASQNANAVNITGGAIAGVSLNNVQGNVGIGTVAPISRFHVNVTGTAANVGWFGNNNDGGGVGMIAPTKPGLTTHSGDTLWFGSNFNGGLVDLASMSTTFVRAGAHNVQDLGTNALRWKDGHFHGAVYIAGNAAWHSGNDGGGSGLDADLLDGQHAAAFAAVAHNHNISALTGYGTMASQNANGVNITGGAIAGVSLNNVQGNVGIGTAAPVSRFHVNEPNPVANVGWFGNYNGAGGVGMIDAAKAGIASYLGSPLYFGSNFAGGLVDLAVLSTTVFRPGSNNAQDLGENATRWKNGHFHAAVYIAGNAAWHPGNDGAGSGLDADLLDGQQGAFYLPAGSYTAADVLAKLLTVDGTGSGLDADLLDGLHAASFVKYTDFTGANQSLGTGGYQKIPGGYIFVTGTYFVNANSTANITFPISMPNECMVVSISGGRADFAAQDNNPHVSTQNVNGFTVYSSSDASVSGRYLAVGY